MDPLLRGGMKCNQKKDYQLKIKYKEVTELFFISHYYVSETLNLPYGQSSIHSNKPFTNFSLKGSGSYLQPKIVGNVNVALITTCMASNSRNTIFPSIEA